MASSGRNLGIRRDPPRTCLNHDHMADPQTGQNEPLASGKQVMAQSEADADEDIPHPTFEVYRHTLLRGANMGAFLTIALGPPVLFIRGVRQPSEMFRRLARVCVKGVVSILIILK